MVTRFTAAGSRPGRVPSTKPPRRSPGTKPPAAPRSGRPAKPRHPPATPNHPGKTQHPGKAPHSTHTFSPNHPVPATPPGGLPPEVNHHLAKVPHLAGIAFATDAAILPTDLGHHPIANGRGGLPSLRHGGASKRARILSYNSTTNTAVVQFGDTPDSPTLSIPVGAAISSSEISAASMAGVDLWDDSDPTDMLITQVL